MYLRFPKEFVSDIVTFTLANPNLKFDNDYFNQIKATAMGTIFAPTYADLTMKFSERRCYQLCRSKFGEELASLIFEDWSSFLNDCETLLEENKINANDLLSILLSINPSIQFTMECTNKAIPFLDILIKSNNDQIWVDIYYESTDTHSLPFSSNHPNYCKYNIPLTLTCHICIIVENTEAKLKQLENLKMSVSKF